MTDFATRSLGTCRCFSFASVLGNKPGWGSEGSEPPGPGDQEEEIRHVVFATRTPQNHMTNFAPRPLWNLLLFLLCCPRKCGNKLRGSRGVRPSGTTRSLAEKFVMWFRAAGVLGSYPPKKPNSHYPSAVLGWSGAVSMALFLYHLCHPLLFAWGGPSRKKQKRGRDVRKRWRESREWRWEAGCGRRRRGAQRGRETCG